MADWTDEASATTELLEKVALSNVKNVKRLTPMGYCHNCRENLAHDLTFCDADCRDDWERVQSAKRRAGR